MNPRRWKATVATAAALLAAAVGLRGFGSAGRIERGDWTYEPAAGRLARRLPDGGWQEFHGVGPRMAANCLSRNADEQWVAERLVGAYPEVRRQASERSPSFAHSPR